MCYCIQIPDKHNFMVTIRLSFLQVSNKELRAQLSVVGRVLII